MGRTLVANRWLAGSACGKRRIIRPLKAVVSHLMTSYPSRFTPVFLGSSVCIALANVLGTILFTVTVWVALGGGVPLADAYTHAMNTPTYLALGFGAQIVASAAGGYTAARFSAHQPYLNSTLVGTVLISWYFVMLATPIQTMKVDPYSIVLGVLLPIPAAVFGAYVYARRGRDG